MHINRRPFSEGATSEEDVAQDSPTGSLAAEDFDAPVPVTVAGIETNSSTAINGSGTVGEEESIRELNAQTLVVEGSGAQIPPNSTIQQSTLAERSGAIDESIANEKVAENSLPLNESASEPIGQAEPSELTPAQDSVTNDRIGSELDFALGDFGRVTEPINAANILFFNRSEISTICFQVSQNNPRNGRQQLAQNAQIVAQCLMDAPPQPLTCNPVDMVFVVDGSGSIGEGNFVIMKNWIRQFINTYLDTGTAQSVSSNVGLLIKRLKFI